VSLRCCPQPPGERVRLRGGMPPVVSHTVRAIVRGAEVYVVPRADGETIVGATSEERGAYQTVTAGAVHDLLHDAMERPGADRACPRGNLCRAAAGNARQRAGRAPGRARGADRGERALPQRHPALPGDRRRRGGLPHRAAASGGGCDRAERPCHAATVRVPLRVGRRLGAADSCADRAGWRAQIDHFWGTRSGRRSDRS
jgi:hypothetical protein